MRIDLLWSVIEKSEEEKLKVELDIQKVGEDLKTFIYEYVVVILEDFQCSGDFIVSWGLEDFSYLLLFWWWGTFSFVTFSATHLRPVFRWIKCETHLYIYPTPPLGLDVTQDQFLKRRFPSRYFPKQDQKTQSTQLLVNSWRENNWIHTFPKGFSAM